MAYFEDLSPYAYSFAEDEMVNIGWLDDKHDFKKDVISSDKIARSNFEYLMLQGGLFRLSCMDSHE